MYVTLDEARKKYDRAVASLDAIRVGEFDVADEEKAVEDAWAEVLAAVRAECAAKVRALPSHTTDGYYGELVKLDSVLAALEAQP